MDMIKGQRHTRQFQALILLLIFAGSILAQTTHCLLPHDSEIPITSHNDQTTSISAKHTFHCPVCEFEFCTFIPQKQAELPANSYRIQAELVCVIHNRPVDNTLPLFQLRAPPAA